MTHVEFQASRPPPTLANLEFRYMDKLVSSKSPENLRMAKKLSNNSRYIDDIGVCNMNNNDFMICSKDIYPESIPLTDGCIENDRYFFGFRYYYRGE